MDATKIGRFMERSAALRAGRSANWQINSS